MLQKAVNRRLLVTTCGPGHHRPAIAKQLKCQIAAPRQTGRTRGQPNTPAAQFKFEVRQRRAGYARGRHPDDAIEAEMTLDSAAALCLSPRAIKPAACHADIRHPWASAPATLPMAQALATRQLPRSKQNRNMPTFCTRYDFLLIRLHDLRAGPISESVTSQERVGRSMVDGASTVRGRTVAT